MLSDGSNRHFPVLQHSHCHTLLCRRHDRRPATLAATRPAKVRSLSSSRSNWVNAANRWKTSVPVGALVSQQAVVQDVAAKIMCDNLQTLAALTARDQVDRINHAYARTALKPLMPALLLGKKVAKRLREVLNLIGKQT